MKKGIAVVSALTMAAVMCAGFAACGSKSEAEKIVSEEVTQAEWEAAFAEENFENCKLVFTEIYEGKGTISSSKNDNLSSKNDNLSSKNDNLSSKSDNSSSKDDNLFENSDLGEPHSSHTVGKSIWGKQTIAHIYVQDGAKCYCKTSVKNEGDYLGVIPEGETEIYWANSNKYTVTGSDVSVEIVASMTSVYDMVINVKEYYEYFEYSKDSKGYILKEDAPKISDWYWRESGIFKFQNGKVAAFLYSHTYINKYGSETTTEQMLFTYGGQTVTVPEV